MSFFPLSSKLLSETSFLNYLSRVNEEFIALDPVEYEAQQAKGQSFKLDNKTWAAKCKDEKTQREENGVLQSFKTYALSRILALVNFDIGNYLNDRKAGKVKDGEQFMQELSAVKEQIVKAPYLAPVAAELLDTLNAVPKDSAGPASVGNTKPETDGEDTLRWNGSIASLCTIFRDLRTQPTGGGKEPHLDYSSEDLGVFILKHFRNENGEMFPMGEIKAGLEASNGRSKKGNKS
jgi:hypothetical protein